jgi:hypothetical protein
LSSSDLELLVAVNGDSSVGVPTTDVVRIPEQPDQYRDYSAMTTTVRIPFACLSAYNPEVAESLDSTSIETLSEGGFMIDDLALQR